MKKPDDSKSFFSQNRELAAAIVALQKFLAFQYDSEKALMQSTLKRLRASARRLESLSKRTTTNES